MPKIKTSECAHPTKERLLLNGGLARCKICGAIRGADGIWREQRA